MMLLMMLMMTRLAALPGPPLGRQARGTSATRSSAVRVQSLTGFGLQETRPSLKEQAESGSAEQNTQIETEVPLTVQTPSMTVEGA